MWVNRFDKEPDTLKLPLSTVATCCLCSILFAGAANSGNAPVDDLFNLSLEELLNVKISVATQTQETLSQAPSSVTVFNRKEIERMGIENVYELLNYVPGFQVTRAVDLAGESRINARGVASENGHILVMLNGHRLNESYFGRATLYNRYLVTHNVKRIEVIRGPGSALYGSNAFLGVVNIITDEETSNVRVQAGSHDYYAVDGNTRLDITDEISSSLSLSYQGSEGEDYAFSSFPDTQDPWQNINLYSRTRMHDFALDIGYMKYRNEDFITFNAVANPGITETETENLILSLSHETRVSDQFEIKSALTYSQHTIDHIGLLRPATPPAINYDLFAGPYSRSQYFELKTHGTYVFDNNNELTAGLVFRREGVDYLGANTNHLTPDGWQISPLDQYYLGSVQRFKQIGQLDSSEEFQNIYGGFIQYKHNVSEKLLSYLGVRYDHYSVVGNTLNPRIGLIYQANQDAVFKFLYGTAFKSPILTQLYADTPRSIGNINLDPEKVATTELIYQQKLDQSQIDITLFHNNFSDLIDVDIGGAPGGLDTWDNTIEDENSGVEASITAQWIDDLLLKLSVTHLFSTINTGTYDNFASFVANYHMNKWNFNLNGYYRDHADNALNQGNYLVANSKISYNLERDTKLFLNIKNLTDKDYVTYEPKLASLNNAVPNLGRAVILGMELGW